MAQRMPVRSYRGWSWSDTSPGVSQKRDRGLATYRVLPRPLRHPGNLGAKRVQPFLDALIAALDLVGIVDGGGALGADGRAEHPHAAAHLRPAHPPPAP